MKSVIKDFQCSYARLNRTVFSLVLNIVKVEACLTFSGRLFQILAAENWNVASPCLVLTLGTCRRPVPEVLRDLDGSYGSNMSEMYFGARP